MNYYIKFLIQLIICFLLGACVGIERQYRKRVVGLRTIILVSIGSFLFVKFSFVFPKADMTRIAAQIVAGIGFLGAGVIIKDSKHVKGLTTAATLWCSAAIGILCSANLLFEAAIGTFFILFTNIILRTINSKIDYYSSNINYDTYFISITTIKKAEKIILEEIKNIVKNSNAIINNIEINEIENDNIKIDICILTNTKKDILSSDIIQKIITKKEVISFNLNKNDTNHLFDEEKL